MKHQCKCSLRDYLSKRLAKARKEAGMTQSRFSELLMMDTRPYADLEHAQSFCCTLTFILYLCFCCKDVMVWSRICGRSCWRFMTNSAMRREVFTGAVVRSLLFSFDAYGASMWTGL